MLHDTGRNLKGCATSVNKIKLQICVLQTSPKHPSRSNIKIFSCLAGVPTSTGRRTHSQLFLKLGRIRQNAPSRALITRIYRCRLRLQPSCSEIDNADTSPSSMGDRYPGLHENRPLSPDGSRIHGGIGRNSGIIIKDVLHYGIDYWDIDDPAHSRLYG
jgi:hypothetical protein